MTIRPATVDDVPAVLPMVGRICALHEGLDPAKYCFLGEPGRMYDRWLRGRVNDTQSVFLVAVREDPAPPDSGGGQVVGFLVGTVEREIPIYRVERYGFLHDLWVEPEYRHEGLGRQMVMLAVEKFKQIGVPQVRCDTAFGNEPARALFRACGFRPSTVEMLLEVGPAHGTGG